MVEVEGAKVETLAWGERGKPGLMFLHGGAAHADWWSFIAPFFAHERRVVAPTFTGMGRSGWRPAYDFRQFVREAREAAQEAGAYGAGPPTVVGHSFGGRIAVGLAHDFGDELAAGGDGRSAVLRAAEPAQPVAAPLVRQGAHNVRPSLEAIIARFRLAPPRPATICSFSTSSPGARRGRPDAEGKGGWSLSFDPHFWEKFARLDPVFTG